jgi:hypothetical protein
MAARGRAQVAWLLLAACVGCGRTPVGRVADAGATRRDGAGPGDSRPRDGAADALAAADVPSDRAPDTTPGCVGARECFDNNPCTEDRCEAGVCSNPPVVAGFVCRPAAGSCDRAEVCNGAVCPPDQLAAVGTVCRPSLGACDVAESCTGGSALCPGDLLLPPGSVCRLAEGVCDLPERCTGSAICPPDQVLGPGDVCRRTAGPCDRQESCDGRSKSCPPDTFLPPMVTCRPAAGSCDLLESCTGTGPACPADRMATPATVCRLEAGPCDVAERCDGVATGCPADAFRAMTEICRGPEGVCDRAEACTGFGPACPADLVAPATAVCRSAAGPCDLDESCDGASKGCPTDGFRSPMETCRPAAGDCDRAEACTGSGPACPDDAVAPSQEMCRPAADACDVDELCDGVAKLCPPDMFASAATTCRKEAGDCDLPELCTGDSAACPMDVMASVTRVCREAVDLCDLEERCDGMATTCPPDGVAAPGFVCRKEQGPCDRPETCDGTAASCPDDQVDPCPVDAGPDGAVDADPPDAPDGGVPDAAPDAPADGGAAIVEQAHVRWRADDSQTALVAEARVRADRDDAEEDQVTTIVDLDSATLDMVRDQGSGRNQFIGLRFSAIPVPRAATVSEARVQFTASEVSTGPANLFFAGQAVDDGPAFTSAPPGNISTRTSLTMAIASWLDVPAWSTIGQAGADQRTPDLSAIVQEIVNRPGWNAGNALVLLSAGEGTRVARAFDQRPEGPSTAPLLQVTYLQGTSPAFLTAEDALLAGVPPGVVVRLRLLCANAGSGAATAGYQLQVAEAMDCTSGGYAPVLTDGSGPWRLADAAFLSDGAPTANEALTDPMGGVFVRGQFKEAGNTTAPITLAAGEFTEIEFAVSAVAGNARPRVQYCFRVVDAAGATELRHTQHGRAVVRP